MLQPSLSGNARMAVICCATPSELYLEETRSTLQFASRAKLVKTRAQINEVMDERSMIKKLQRELAEAKKATSVDAGNMKQVKELEFKATHAETAAMILQEKFERLTTSILRGGVNALINDRKRMAAKSPKTNEMVARFADLLSPSVLGADKKRRRQSDGFVSQVRNEESPLLDVTNKSNVLATFTPAIPRKVKIRPKLLENSPSFQLVLLKDALAAKSELTKSLNVRLAEWQDKAEKYESSLEGAAKEISDLKKAESSSEEAIQILSAEKEALEIQRQDIIDEFQEQLSDKEKAIQDSLETMESILKEKEMLQETVVSLETEREALEEVIAVRDHDCARMQASIEKTTKEYQIELEKLKNELEIERGHRGALESEHDSTKSSLMTKVQGLENLNEKKEKMIMELEKENESLFESNGVLTAKVEEMEDILRAKNDEFSEKNQYHISFANQLNEEKHALEMSLSASESEKAGLIVSVAEKSIELDQCLSKIRLMEQSHQEQLKELQQSYVTISNELQDSYNSEVAMLYSQQQTLIIALAETASEHNQLSSRNINLEEQIEQQKVISSKAQTLVKGLEEKCFEFETSKSILKASVENNERVIENIKLEKKSLISELESSKMEIETLLDEKEQMTEQMKLATDAIMSLRSNCLLEENEADDLSTLRIIESVSKRFHEIESKNIEFKEEVISQTIQLDEQEKELNDMKNHVDHLTEKYRDHVNQLQLYEALASGLSEKENQKDCELNQLRQKVVQKEDEMKSLESQITVLSACNDQLSNELCTRNTEYEKLSEQLQLAEALSLHISYLEDEKNHKIKMNDVDLEAKDEKMESLTRSLKMLNEEKEKLLEEIEVMKSSSSSKEDNLNSQLTEQLSKIHELKSSLEEALKERVSVESSLDEALTTIETLKKDILDLQNRLEESQMNYSVEKQKSVDALSEVQNLRKKIDSSDQESMESIQDSHLLEQVTELQQLLLAANAREEEANRIAIAADQELELKEKELEEVSLFASECESALKKMEEKNSQLQSQLSFVNTSNNGGLNEIVKDMEILMEEKLEVEQKMEEMKIAIQHREDELNNNFEKERTQLLQDAQERIESLKRDLEETESELLKHKEDATATRRELIGLEEQLRSDQTAAIDSDEKLLHLSEQLSASEVTIASLRQDFAALQEEYDLFKAHVTSSKDTAKQSCDDKVCSLREELSLLKDELHNQSLKAKSAEEKLSYFEQETIRLQNELKTTKQTLIREKEFAVSKLKEELALGKVQVSRAEAKMFELTEKVEQYRNKIENSKQYSEFGDVNENNLQRLLHEKQEEYANQAQVITDLQSEVKVLKENIEKLNFKIESKDERISSLKKKALTKEHVNMIKTLKTERAEYKDKVDKYKLELDMLKSKQLSTSHPSEELDDLYAKQIALEEKLRKYVAHCEFQKKEKDAIIDLIKSTIDNDNLGSMADEDLGEAITALCERLKLLEDEVECLMGVKEELSQTEMKLKLAEESRFVLQTSLDEMQEKIKYSSDEKENLAKQLKNVNEEVHKLKEKQEKLQQISASVQGSASELEAEKNRQVSYLERENLQFLAEVKQLKQEIRKLKSERKFSSVVATDDEPTEDLGFISKLVSNDKENNPNHNISAEKSSIIKSRYGLGAGEGDINDDNTQECQTS